MARMSRERMTQTAIKILDKIASEQELNDLVTDARAAMDAEIDLIAENTVLKGEIERLKGELEKHRVATGLAEYNKKALEQALVRAVGENDELRKKLDDVPRWLYPKMTEEIPDEVKQEIERGGEEWVMVISPRMDWLNWTTIAQTMCRYHLATFKYPDRRMIVVGRKEPKKTEPD